jgi:metal-sulfur cluster biosynthetic enzyme
MVTKAQIMKALRGCYDPEIAVNVVDLGLIYGVRVDRGRVRIKMTLTTPGCPMHGLITEEIKEKVKKVKGVKEVNIDLTFKPPWTPDRMAKDVKKKLGW